VGALVDLSLLAAPEAEDHFIFLGDDFGEIDIDILCVDAPAGGISCIIRDLRSVDRRLRGRTSNVHARSTEILFLDERYRPTQVSQAIRQRITALARTHDDGVVFHKKRSPVRNRAKTIHRMQRRWMRIAPNESRRRVAGANYSSQTG